MIKGRKKAKIDIIIPAYNAHKTIEKALYSICMQEFNENINVYICNDASKKDYKDIINRFKDVLNITEITIEKNSGPGVARQIGIDSSSSKYIIFMDSDDELYNPYSIRILYEEIENNKCDVVASSFLDEKRDFVYYKDSVWLHGKIYRRSFLEKNNIRFNESRENEDNYFNRSIIMRTKKIKYIDNVLYVWKNNEKSITRKNNHEYKFTGLFGYIKNMIQVLEEAIDDKIDRNIISENVTYIFYSIYFHYLDNYDHEDKDKLIKESRKLKNMYDIYKIRDEYLEKRAFANQFDYFTKKTDPIVIMRPKITFEEFLKLYEKK